MVECYAIWAIKNSATGKQGRYTLRGNLSYGMIATIADKEVVVIINGNAYRPRNTNIGEHADRPIWSDLAYEPTGNIRLEKIALTVEVIAGSTLKPCGKNSTVARNRIDAPNLSAIGIAQPCPKISNIKEAIGAELDAAAAIKLIRKRGNDWILSGERIKRKEAQKCRVNSLHNFTI